MMNEIKKMGINNLIKTNYDVKFITNCENCNSCPLENVLEEYLIDGEYHLSKRDIYWNSTPVKSDENCEVRIFNRCYYNTLEHDYFYCDYHNRYELKNDGFERLSYGDYCIEVREDVWDYCADCGTPVLLEGMFNGLCENCADTVEIYEYHEFDDLHFFGNPIDDIYYGVEIETSYDRDSYECGLEDSILFKRIISPNRIVDNISHYEEDCSISGIECVTQPMSFEFISNNMHHITNHLDSCGLYTKKGNGLHIHISRTDKVERNLHKVLYFFENNKDDIVQFSGRRWQEIEEWTDFYYLESESACYDKLNSGCSRYRCINNTNDCTVEFRIFRSSLDEELILGAVEFIKILFEMIDRGFCLRYADFDDVLDFAHSYDYDNFIYRYEHYML